MFENQPNNQQPAPSNLPVAEPEDIFAGVDAAPEGAPPAVDAPVPNALGAGLLKAKSSAPESPFAPVGDFSVEQPVEYAAKAPIVGKIIMVIVIIAVVGGVGYGGWWGYNNYFKAATPSVPAPVIQPEVPAVNPLLPTTTAQIVLPQNVTTNSVDQAAKIKNDNILFGTQQDSDNDGIDDLHEKQIGTNPINPDTDGDGLNDGQEVNVWHTDPLNPDIDGDGYGDGVEVSGGYNPLGPGKLTSFPAGYSTSTASTSTK